MKKDPKEKVRKVVLKCVKDYLRKANLLIRVIFSTKLSNLKVFFLVYTLPQNLSYRQNFNFFASFFRG